VKFFSFYACCSNFAVTNRPVSRISHQISADYTKCLADARLSEFTRILENPAGSMASNTKMRLIT
jgi:hypothetical protein